MNAQTTTPQPGDTIYAEWAVGPAQRGSGWVDVRQAKNLTAYTVGEPLGLTMTVVLPSGGHITIREGYYLTEADVRAAEEVYEDETNDCIGAERAIECSMNRTFQGFTPQGLQRDYVKHGNAWPFSGDHLGTVYVRERYFTGTRYESGDVIGRERVHTARPDVWSMVREEFRVTHLEHDAHCDGCRRAAKSARAHAKATGSVGATSVDDGRRLSGPYYHQASVTRSI